MRVQSIALGVAIAAIVAAVAWRSPLVKSAVTGAANVVGVSLTPANSPTDLGPSYLVDNQPWMYGAPASAVTPSVAQQTAGGTPGIIAQFSRFLTKT